MNIASRNTISRQNDIILPYVKLNPQNSYFRLQPVVPTVEGVEYTVTFMLDDVSASNQVLLFLPNAQIGTYSTYSFKPYDSLKTLSAIATVRAYVDGPSFVTEIDGQETERVMFPPGVSPVYFCIGGHSNVAQTFSSGKIFEVTLKTENISCTYVPVEVDGIGKLKCMETGAIFSVTKDEKQYPPKYGELKIS